MRRTTTDTHRLVFPISLQLVDDMQITYCQRNRIVLVKDMDEVRIDDKKAIVELGQDETALFVAEAPVEIQVKLAMDGEVIATKPLRIPVERILNEDFLEV